MAHSDENLPVTRKSLIFIPVWLISHYLFGFFAIYVCDVHFFSYRPYITVRTPMDCIFDKWKCKADFGLRGYVTFFIIIDLILIV